MRFIGAGGMGEVYAADDQFLQATVALKTLRPELEHSAVALERFRREVALARRVTNAHVCRLHDAGEHAGCVFLTMELLDGQTLAERLRTDGPLSIEDLENIAMQLTDGLAALHAEGIVHRDFKTANIVLVGDRAVIGNEFVLLQHLVDLAPTQIMLWQPEQAERGLAEAERFATARGDRFVLAWIECMRGNIAMRRGRLDEAATRLENALQLAEQVQNPSAFDAPFGDILRTVATGLLWDIAFERSDDAAYAAALARHRTFLAHAPHSIAEHVTTVHEATFELRRNNLAKARELAASVLAHPRRTPWTAEADVVLARLDIRAGNTDSAAARLDAARPLLTGSPVHESTLVLGEAELRAARGDLGGAVALLDAFVEKCGATCLHMSLPAEVLAADLAARAAPRPPALARSAQTPPLASEATNATCGKGDSADL